MSALTASSTRAAPDPDELAEEAVADTYLTFVLASQIFVVPVANVREILDLQSISRLPNAPGDLVGMIDVRGQGIGVVDLASRLGLRLEGGAQSRIVVLELGDGPERAPLGIVADRVLSVAEIDPTTVEAAPRTMSSWEAREVRGITRLDGQIAILLNLGAIFSSDPALDPAFVF
ncbi:chemotaxis protein CheW [Jannaschia formosa]|uniref:chemotaxis protein CheW n=1 Tax=Jannaschia formosa TaxID=2259592 RepID=UPI000E1BAC73|nr:chemotaxis protein CheW [Jannaschia formosa]TFL17929.1 chemotaxis protein CheW [Jannaschia formosa]